MVKLYIPYPSPHVEVTVPKDYAQYWYNPKQCSSYYEENHLQVFSLAIKMTLKPKNTTETSLKINQMSFPYLLDES